MITSKDECVIICDLSDLTLHIIFDAWWASMNVGPKSAIACNGSRHASSWQFYLHCGIEKPGNPGMVCIIWYHALRHPSEHGTSSIGKHLLATAHITKLHKLTDSEVTELTSSTLNEIALAILKRQGSRGIAMVRSQRQFIYDIALIPYSSKWQTNIANWRLRTMKVPNFTKTRGIATSC